MKRFIDELEIPSEFQTKTPVQRFYRGQDLFELGNVSTPEKAALALRKKLWAVDGLTSEIISPSKRPMNAHRKEASPERTALFKGHIPRLFDPVKFPEAYENARKAANRAGKNQLKYHKRVATLMPCSEKSTNEPQNLAQKVGDAS